MALAHCEEEGERWAKKGAALRAMTNGPSTNDQGNPNDKARMKSPDEELLREKVEIARGFGWGGGRNVEMAQGCEPRNTRKSAKFGGAAAWTGFKRTEANKGNETWNTQKITWNRWNYGGL